MLKTNLHFFGDTVTVENSPIENENNERENNPETNNQSEESLKKKIEDITNESSKKIKELKSKIDRLNKQNLSNEEIRQLEMSEKEKELVEKEKKLLEKENRLYAIRAIKIAGLDDGTDRALSIVDFVYDEDTSKIDEKVKIFKKLINSLVSNQIDKAFKENGRIPNNALSVNANLNKKFNIAENLGQRDSERLRESNKILNYYIGR